MPQDSLKTTRLSVIFQRYKNWYAAAYPGMWLEPRNAISFAEALGKLPEPIRVRKTAKCQTYAVLCVMRAVLRQNYRGIGRTGRPNPMTSARSYSVNSKQRWWMDHLNAG